MVWGQKQGKFSKEYEFFGVLTVVNVSIVKTLWLFSNLQNLVWSLNAETYKYKIN